ncbi:BLUF domain-containing protein [uncultured Sulfitobacter sp.]|uniref:BLUF domain-containing protein n=1 Tax=uncultured Sulfitobacter sp. TaxID=191468 RepID=UPI00262FECD3|nr:BLUF domain-containing protein [uncultured Sulfitobacter sp.]
MIYSSQPFGYDVSLLSGILLDARKHNIRDGITGALICRHDIYLQMLEGPADKVNDAIARIGRDDRHVDMKILLSEQSDSRLFGDWAMLHDPAKTVIWSDTEIADGILDTTSPKEIKAVFAALSEKVKDGELPA